MDKAAFIEQYVKEAREYAIATGAARRSPFNPAPVAARAAAKWDAEHTPEYLALSAKIEALVAQGGKEWERRRVYFNNIRVAGSHEFDVYVDLETGAIVGAQSEKELAAVAARIVL